MSCFVRLMSPNISDQMSSFHDKLSIYKLINLAKVLNSQLIVKYTLMDIFF